ncbi:hypothetical protein KAW48_04355, partial [candidate division WOR-3 bacterium]|nr:hypothetical protein [candidate division WOR-3 bacterium]
CVKHIEEGGSATHHVISKGNKLKSNVSCRIEFDVDNPGGWGVSGADDEDFSLLPGGTHTNTYTSTNMGATAPLDVFYQVGARCAMVGGEGYYWSAQGHMFDHPDENQSPGEMNYPTPWITRTRTDSLNPGLPDIGIMLSGWADGYGHILGRYDISTLPVKPNLKIINQPDMDISDSVKLLVIGSAGLKGFDSQLMAQKLESYVINGGKILVFTQKWGSDLSVLPGGIDGYGWSEDQACFANAAYLNQRHPVFSGQESQVMSCNVDGYITQYPDNAEVLLRRTANGMPALLSYSYGAGRVIVSSLYPDWGYGHNQTSPEELRLLRDITTWALNPEMPIPEFYPDSAVSVPVSIRYTADDTVEAITAIVKVFTPDRDLYDSVVVPVSLQPGDEIQWDWNESSLPQNLGLWIIDYALMDGNGEEIQSFERGAIFAQRVDVPVGNYNLGDFQIWANSDKEEVIPGDTVNYEIFIRNNTPSSLNGKVMIGVHEERDEGGIWWELVDSITDVTIPPDTVVKIVYQRPLWLS